jgi:hypothetical protein
MCQSLRAVVTSRALRAVVTLRREGKLSHSGAKGDCQVSTFRESVTFVVLRATVTFSH